MRVAVAAIVAVLMAINAAAQKPPSAAAPCGNQSARPDDLPKEIAFFKKLQVAIACDDKNAVASMVRFPLIVNGLERQYTVKNRRSFLRAYGDIISKKIRSNITRQRPECIFGNWQGFMAGDGDIWFDYTATDPDVKVFVVNTPTS